MPGQFKIQACPERQRRLGRRINNGFPTYAQRVGEIAPAPPWAANKQWVSANATEGGE
jgi:hypothetical protein